MKYNTDFVSPLAAKEIEKDSRSHFATDRLGVKGLHNIVAMPGYDTAGLYQDGFVIPSSMLHRQMPTRSLFSPVGITSESTIECPVFYLGVVCSCWGHCLTDSFKFLWPLLEVKGHEFLKNCKFICIPWHVDEKIPVNYFSVLESLGIERKSIIEIRRPTLIEKCYLADECFWCEGARTCREFSSEVSVRAKRWFSREYQGVLDRLCDLYGSRNCIGPKKIYFSRTGWNRWEFGEQYVEAAFRRSGFEIVRPEHLSLADLISLVYNADVLATTGGSCAHNALFMHRGASLVIVRKYDFVNQYQLAINEAKDLNVTYVDAYKSFIFYSPSQRNQGPFFIYVSKNLARLLGVPPEFPIGEFVRYVVWSSYMKYGHLVCEYLRRMRRMLKSCGTVYPRRRLSLRRSGI